MLSTHRPHLRTIVLALAALLLASPLTLAQQNQTGDEGAPGQDDTNVNVDVEDGGLFGLSQTMLWVLLTLVVLVVIVAVVAIARAGRTEHHHERD